MECSNHQIACLSFYFHLFGSLSSSSLMIQLLKIFKCLLSKVSNVDIRILLVCIDIMDLICCYRICSQNSIDTALFICTDLIIYLQMVASKKHLILGEEASRLKDSLTIVLSSLPGSFQQSYLWAINLSTLHIL